MNYVLLYCLTFFGIPLVVVGQIVTRTIRYNRKLGYRY